jgi:hypothetical protein
MEISETFRSLKFSEIHSRPETQINLLYGLKSILHAYLLLLCFYVQLIDFIIVAAHDE